MISFGYLVFDQLPDVQTLAGAAIVVASGIYLFRQERKAAQRASVAELQ
jgi:drug/metabolite transporter (DMT)-like permease